MDKVLIIDDDGELRSVVGDVLKEEGFSVFEAPDGIKGVKAFRADPPDAVLLDLNMPHRNGIETLQEIRRIDTAIPVIMLTAYGDIPTAVEAIKHGAYDFMVKPPDFDKLIITIRRSVEKRALEAEVRKANAALQLSLQNIFGKSKAITALISQICRVAPTDISLLIQGETGTGKSVLAETIRNLSARADKPFVSMDIGLIPDLLIESELFGYKKGAFTGADRDKAGYLETAHQGTIFIDELENMSPHVQTKFLSFIEKKKILPLGSTTPVELDVRIIAAANTDIKAAVQKKEFRQDLFYRLGEFIVTVPPLRERIEDIPFFAKKFLYQVCADLNKQIREISDDAVSRLTEHDWPGNLRELKNIIRKAALLTNGDVITRKCIESLLLGMPCAEKCGSGPRTLKNALKELEKNMILDAIEKTGGNKSRTAELLEVSYPKLLAKLKEYKIR